jgi:hypothetical protein
MRTGREKDKRIGRKSIKQERIEKGRGRKKENY